MHEGWPISCLMEVLGMTTSITTKTFSKSCVQEPRRGFDLGSPGVPAPERPDLLLLPLNGSQGMPILPVGNWFDIYRYRTSLIASYLEDTP